MSDDQLAIVKIESSEESRDDEDAIEDSDQDDEDKEGGEANKTDERDPNAEYMILHKVEILLFVLKYSKLTSNPPIL